MTANALARADLRAVPVAASDSPVITLLVGLPGSGKTYFARHELQRRAAADKRGTLFRLSRDGFRGMGLDEEYGPTGRIPGTPAGPLPQEVEDVVTGVRDAALVRLIESGVDVIVDETNLDQDKLRGLVGLIESCGARWRVADFTRVSLKLCITRDASRPGRAHVGSDVIRYLHDRHLAPHGGRIPLLDELRRVTRR